MFAPSDFLCVDHVILSVRSSEADVNDPIGIVDPHHQPVLVARNIEHHAAVLEETRAANRPFHARLGVAQSAALTCRYQAINGSRASA
jgi:hypothetical protein